VTSSTRKFLGGQNSAPKGDGQEQGKVGKEDQTRKKLGRKGKKEKGNQGRSLLEDASRKKEQTKKRGELRAGKSPESRGGSLEENLEEAGS